MVHINLSKKNKKNQPARAGDGSFNTCFPETGTGKHVLGFSWWTSNPLVSTTEIVDLVLDPIKKNNRPIYWPPRFLDLPLFTMRLWT